MIDIPLNKALAAVKKEAGCLGCYLKATKQEENCFQLPCHASRRKDGKNVIFKLVDWPTKEIDDLTTMSEIYSRGHPDGF